MRRLNNGAGLSRSVYPILATSILLWVRPALAADTASPAAAVSVYPAALLLSGALLALAAAMTLFLRMPRVRDAQLRRACGWVIASGMATALTLLIGATQVPADAAPISFWPLSDTAAQVLKLLIVVAALAYLILELTAPRSVLARTWQKVRRPAVILLGVSGLAAYWNFGAFHFTQFTHQHELLHYYLGSKHGPELRYTRLYDCILQAQLEEQPELVNLQTQRVQDLVSNRLVFATELQERLKLCPQSFSPERWLVFKRDVVALRSIAGAALWNSSLIDFGFNAPPTWNVIPSAITRNLDLSAESLRAVALIDPLLILAGLGCIAWAFGLEVACLAACFFGVFFPSRFFWTGGGFMRQDWLACLLAGLALLRRNFPVAAGFFLGCSGLFRLFPFAFLALPFTSAALNAVQTRRVEAGLWRLALGVLLACVTLVPLGARSMGGFSSYGQFYENSVKHLSTPYTNNIGLASLLSFRPRPNFSAEIQTADLNERLVAYREMRQEAFSSVRYLFVALALSFFAMTAWYMRRERRMWVLSILGFVLIPVGTNLACYYFSFLMVATVLWREEPRIVVFLFLLAAASQILGLTITSDELLYAAISMVVLYVCLESVLTYRLRLLSRESDTPD